MRESSRGASEILAERKARGESPRSFWLSDREAMLGVVFCLLVFGTINIFSSSFFLGITDFDSPYFFLKKHLINVAVGMVAFGIFQHLDYHKLRNLVTPGAVAVIAMLVLVFILGEEINGAKRWLKLGPVTLQPSEFAKLLTILIAAAVAAQGERLAEWKKYWGQGGLVLAMAALVEFEPDGATAAIVAGIPAVMLLCSALPSPVKKNLMLMGVGMAGIILIMQPYRIKRFISFLDPWSDPDDAGYQIIQSMSAIGSGGWMGMGVGQGISKYKYLPEAHTDFAFSIWCQEQGFLGAVLVFICFLALAYYGQRISYKAKDLFGQFLAAGITFLLVGQGVVNMLMIAGFFPVVGVPLPFISYGGTSLMVTMTAVGMLSNISVYSEKKEKENRQPAGRPSLKLVYSRNTRREV
ncbi:MAG: putative peptidoglycan glycosyltransferase FtsW [Selenomonadaceae bacterium]|nr:putative peptidoglycan glycosyltransferase FtsW [Selenomonadaceae bacterium]